MNTTAQRDDPQVLIRHWRSTCLVSNAHPRPSQVRDRLDAALRHDLPAALAARLAGAFRGSGDEIIFVRRLDLDFAVDASWDSDAIAAQCAEALDLRLARELSGGDLSNTIRFSGPDDYLARVLVDRASGDAGSRWYYAKFSGLHALPCGAALRTALLEDIDLGVSALRALNPRDLANVIAALGDTECKRLVEALVSGPKGSDARALTALASLVRTAAPGSFNSASQLALWWLAQVRIHIDRSVALATRAIAHAMIALRGNASRAESLLGAIGDGDAAKIAEFARGDTESFLHLRACPPTLLRDLFVLERIRAPEMESLGGTPFGGPFMLLDDLFALPVERTTTGWPALESVPAAAVLRFLVLCRCGGGAHAAAMFADPLWRNLFGIAPTIGRAAVAEWLAALGPRCRHGFARMLMRAEAGAAPLRPVIVPDAGERRYRILVGDGGEWHALGYANARADSDVDEAALDDDIAYLLKEDDALPSGWALLVALAAQRVERRFLRRLPGFSTSHLAYARRNLLEFSASLEAQPERIVVRLGRPPLGLILNFTGCNRGTRHWPALAARPFALFNQG